MFTLCVCVAMVWYHNILGATDNGNNFNHLCSNPSNKALCKPTPLKLNLSIISSMWMMQAPLLSIYQLDLSFVIVTVNYC